MSTPQDYYKLLEIDKKASADEIKKAYRKLAMKYHPDKNQGNAEAETKFKKINQAYEILSNPEQRAAYDAYGHAGVDGGAGGARGGYQQANASNFNDIFGSIFNDFFGGNTGAGAASGGKRRQSGQRGSDLQYNLELSLDDAIRGTTVEVKMRTMVACKQCKGTGSKDGSQPSLCSTCHGQGEIHIQQGFFALSQPCPACHGKGTVIKDPCRSCTGQGRVSETKTLSIKIPAGVDDGDRIRLGGEGEAGANGGASGDLYVQVSVKEHHIFKRQGPDLYCEIPISYKIAVLGGEIEVPTISGKVKLKIPAETQTGKLLRLRGRGVKTIRGQGPGDCLCKVVVETPVNLTQDQREMLEKFDKSITSEQSKHTPREKSWFQEVKNFFEEMKF